MTSIGFDPEFFVFDKKHSRHVPVTGMVGGSKRRPRETDHGFVQEDGCALEINTVPVDLEDTQAVVDSIFDVKADAKKIVGTNYRLDAIPSVVFAEELLVHPDTWESGCDPDWDVNTSNRNEAYIYQTGQRFAGGHIHIGTDFINEHPQNTKILVMAHDLCVGAYCWLHDKDSDRKKAYGQLGRYRPKEYGIEYRTPSNFWLKSRKHAETMVKLVNKAVHLARNMLPNSIMRYHEELITRVDNRQTKRVREISSYFTGE